MIRLSVLVPTYRRPGLLRSCLAALAAQDEPSDSFEVVVVNDGSGADTERELERADAVMTNLTVVNLPHNQGPAAARNRAVAESRASILLFLDDDVVAPRELVGQHIHAHAVDDPTLGILGRVAWHPDLVVTPFMTWLDDSGLQFAYDTWLQAGPVDPPYGAFYTANLSMRRQLFEQSGGFDERFPYPAYEDMELAWRLTQLRFRLVYRPDVLAYHSRAISLSDFRRRMSKVAESARVLAAVQPEFPLEEGAPLAGHRGRRGRLALAVAAPFARLLRRRDLLEKHFRAEIAASYLAGRRRAETRLTDGAMRSASD